MVAPTRAPQARGVKCDLCKKILAQTTWLDQTKPAKSTEDAQQVLSLINQHDTSECRCIPNSIKNLILGSTHFEIHRLEAQNLDNQVYRRQYENCMGAIQRSSKEEISKRQNGNINDCNDSDRSSRFKIYSNFSDHKHLERSNLLTVHLCKSIDYWKIAMEDQSDTFNSKLALRLGLTHHVIYACYLFKYYKILDYQLLTANLLVNLFNSIEIVTTNAVQHANYLLIKTLIDCDQHHLAKQHLKQATKCAAYQDKSHYETILLTCVSCELNLSETTETYSLLDELAEMAVIRPDDKLQHYYARTLALSIVIKYIHCFKARSDLCFEFYHTFRYVCAIVRRCYESSFELILAEKDSKTQQPSKSSSQVLDHSWIRFAVCDFAFNTLDMLSKFFIRCGLPESLQLLYNGMNLIAYRNGSCYWQARMASLGSKFDILCDKYGDAEAKLDVMSRIIGHTTDPYLMNILRLDLEVSALKLKQHQRCEVSEDVLMDLLRKSKTCRSSLVVRISKLDLYDSKSSLYLKTSDSIGLSSDDLFIFDGCLGDLSFELFKMSVESAMMLGKKTEARELLVKLGSQLDSADCNVIEYNICQTILETILILVDVYRSDLSLLEATKSSRLFMSDSDDSLESKLSSLNLKDEAYNTTETSEKSRKLRHCKTNRLNIKKPSRRKGAYDVSEARFFGVSECIKNVAKLTDEELVVSYLRNSEPNPDYLLYRRAHELMFTYRLKDTKLNHDQLMYHFCESNSANTMRYRWMMYEEQQAAPFECQTTNRCNLGGLRNLSYSNTLVNIDKTVKSFTKPAPDDHRFIQIKYVIDRQSQEEYLLICSFDVDLEPVYARVKRSILSDDFVEAAKTAASGSFDATMTLPGQLLKKVDEAKKTLFFKNHRSRTEIRQRIETEISVILHDMENDWLGPMRFLLCGPLIKKDPFGYDQWVNQTCIDIESIMGEYSCNSYSSLKLFVEHAALLNREEFCKLLADLFNCSISSQEVRDCFNKWLKSLESFVAEAAPGLSKIAFLHKLDRGQLGLILDQRLEFIPFESLPNSRVLRQAFFRVPSLRLYSVISNRVSNGGNSFHARVDANETVYMLDPANNLAKTRERFEKRLKVQPRWLGIVGQEPSSKQMEQWFMDKQVYIFIGHGAGTAYYNKLCRGRGLGAMSLVRPVSIVMGCSSGRVLSEGPNLESFGIGWIFVFRGSPSYVGLLWDVTDTDIDRFLDSLLNKWMHSHWLSGDEQLKVNSSCQTGSSKCKPILLTDAVAQARQVCQYKYLVGSTPIIYGLPILVCSDNPS